MRTGLVLCVAVGGACASVISTGAMGETAPPSPVQGRVSALADATGVVRVDRIGDSGQGRPIHVIRVAGHGETDPDERPALLIVAGLHGQHLVGTDVALGVADRLAQQHADALTDYTVYIAPLMNPDAQAIHRLKEGAARLHARTLTPDDADRDGRIDEDGPSDLNDDGVITMMRVLDPPSWLPATMVIDPDEPRLMRAPKEGEGERARYAVLEEGLDDDGDGKFNEDGPGGVMLDMNFPYRWPEFKDGAGRFPLSEPESLALVDWMLGKSNINAVLVFGAHDNLVNAPVSGRYDRTGRVPEGIEAGDKPYYDKLSEVFKGITGMTGAPKEDTAGSFVGWAYAIYGAPAFSTPVWVRPDLINRDGKPEEDNDGGDADAAQGGQAAARPAPAQSGPTTAELQAKIAEFQSADEERQAEIMAEYNQLHPEVQQRIMAMAQGGEDPAAAAQATQEGAPARPAARPGARAGRAGDKGDDAKWLEYSDEHRGGERFIGWTEFEHPQLGTVEIGGFVPGFKTNPPAEELDRLVDEQTRFALELVERLPKIGPAQTSAEDLGGGVWRVRVRLVNEGSLPTVSAAGLKVRRLTPTVLRIDTPGERLLAGERFQRAWSVPGSGGAAEGEWLVVGAPGDEVPVTVRSSAAGNRELRVRLGE